MADNNLHTPVEIGKDAVALTASKVMIAVISMITSMLLARFRTLNEYGTYSQIIMVTDLVTTILLLGLPNSINFFLAKADTEAERQRFLSVYLTISTVLTVIIGICLYLAMPIIISYFNNPYITTFAYVFAIYPWSSLMVNSLSNTCIVYGKAKALVVFNIVHALISLGILLIARVFNITFQKYMLIFMTYTLITAMFAIVWIRKMAGKLVPLVDKLLLRRIFVFSIPLGLASVVGTVNIELDKLVVGKFFTTEEYAIFANAAKELPVTMLASSLTAVLMPRMVQLLKRDQGIEALKKWGAAVMLSLCFMCVVSGGFIVFAPDVMSLFYSEKYVTINGVLVFRVYSFILLFRITYWGIVLNASGQSKKIFICSIITMVSNLIGNIIFFYIFGFIGPALSTLLSVFLMNLVQLFWTSRIIGIKVKDILPWRNMTKVFSETLLLGICFYVIKYVIFPTYDRSISIIVSVSLGVVWAVVFTIMNHRSIRYNWRLLNV